MEAGKGMQQPPDVLAATAEVLPVNFSGIPNELTEGKYFVVWRYELDEKGKLKKPPFNPTTGERVNITNPRTWGSFNEAQAAYERGGWAGIGIVLTPGRYLVALDFDNCINQGIVTDPSIDQLLEMMPTYYELSPSKRGIRGFVFGSIPGSDFRRENIEIYDRSRYVTLTGQRLPLSPRHVARDPERFAAFYHHIFPQKSEVPPAIIPATPVYRPSHMERFTLEQKIEHWKQNENFRRHFEGTASLWGAGGIHPSKSEADYNLCLLLVYRVGRDASLVDALFRRSGLYDEKWDRTAGNNKTYGQRTVEKAVAKGRTAR